MPDMVPSIQVINQPLGPAEGLRISETEMDSILSIG